MRVVHVLRKYNPREWGGTETAVKRLMDGLQRHGVQSTAYCPALEEIVTSDPLADSGHEVNRFNAFVPVWGISPEQRQQLISVGGNLMSYDLLPKLLSENYSLIHTHAGNRLGGIALTAAKIKKVPLVATIHGGVLDLPQGAKDFLKKPLKGGIEWGKVFGAVFQARKVLSESDAILTCNKKEAQLQQAQFPQKRVIVQPHGVESQFYKRDCKEAALKAFPALRGKDVLLVVGRIDPVKNQGWVVEQAPELLRKFPNAIIVLAGSCTDASYGKMVEKKIQELGLGERILLTGGLAPGEDRLLGLFQTAKVLLLPSISETFGLVLLEAWAAGTSVVSSRTSGALELVRSDENGWLFDLQTPETFHLAVAAALNRPDLRKQYAEAGAKLVAAEYDITVLGGRVRKLYDDLLREKK